VRSADGAGRSARCPAVVLEGVHAMHEPQELRRRERDVGNVVHGPSIEAAGEVREDDRVAAEAMLEERPDALVVREDQRLQSDVWRRVRLGGQAGHGITHLDFLGMGSSIVRDHVALGSTRLDVYDVWPAPTHFTSSPSSPRHQGHSARAPSRGTRGARCDARATAALSSLHFGGGAERRASGMTGENRTSEEISGCVTFSG